MDKTELLAMDTPEIDTLVFLRSPDSISTVLDGETVILDIRSDAYSSLNEVGTAVWNLLENQITFADIREILLAEFDVTTEECCENLISFLKELTDKKLIAVR